MKKFISLLLIFTLVFCFAACGGNETPNENNDNNIVENVGDNSDDNIITSNKEITLEDLENAPVSPESDFDVLDVEGGVSVAYFGDDEIVVIPETIGGKKVVAISRRGFVNAKTVRAVKLADSIEVIGDNAFLDHPSIEILAAGTGLETIGYCAIGGCNNLKVLELNEGLKKIDVAGIVRNPLLTEIYIPGSVVDPKGLSPENAVIICEKGSAAEEYAKNNGYEYRLK